MVELDQITIGKASRNDAAAFRALYNHYAPFVWKVVFKTVQGDTALAADIVQDAFIRIHTSLRSFGATAALSTWIYRIAFNVAMNHLNTVRRYDARHGEPETISRSMESDPVELRDLISKAMGDISPEERFLLTAREVSGFSFEELADITRQKPGALRTKLHRLKNDIRERLAVLDRIDAPVLADSKGGTV